MNKKMTKVQWIFAGLAGLFLTLIGAATYVYLDWGILKIVAVLYVSVVMLLLKEIPLWQRALLSLGLFSLMVLAHFYLPDYIMYWAEVVAALLLFIMAIVALMEFFSSKPGDGSIITIMFLVVIIALPVGLLLLIHALGGLGYEFF